MINIKYKQKTNLLKEEPDKAIVSPSNMGAADVQARADMNPLAATVSDFKKIDSSFDFKGTYFIKDNEVFFGKDLEKQESLLRPDGLSSSAETPDEKTGTVELWDLTNSKRRVAPVYPNLIDASRSKSAKTVEGALVNFGAFQSGENLDEKIVLFKYSIPTPGVDTDQSNQIDKGQSVSAVCFPLDRPFFQSLSPSYGAETMIMASAADGNYSHVMITLDQFVALFGVAIVHKPTGTTMKDVLFKNYKPKLEILGSLLQTGPFYDPEDFAGTDFEDEDFIQERFSDTIVLPIDIEFGYYTLYPSITGGSGGKGNRGITSNVQDAYMDFGIYIETPNGKKLKISNSDTHPTFMNVDPLDDPGTYLLDDDTINSTGSNKNPAKRIRGAIDTLFQKQKDGYFRGAYFTPKVEGSYTTDLATPVAAIKSPVETYTDPTKMALQLYMTRSKYPLQFSRNNKTFYQGWIIFSGKNNYTDRYLGLIGTEMDEMLNPEEDNVRAAAYMVGNLFGQYFNKKRAEIYEKHNVRIEIRKIGIKSGTDFKKNLGPHGWTSMVRSSMNGGAFFKQRPKLDNEIVDYNQFVEDVEAQARASSASKIQQLINDLAEKYSIDSNHAAVVVYTQFLKILREKDDPNEELIRRLKTAALRTLRSEPVETKNLRKRIVIPGWWKGGGGSFTGGTTDSFDEEGVDTGEDGSIDESLQNLRKNKAVVIRKLLK